MTERMAVGANRFSLLFLGVILLVNECSIHVVAHPFKPNNGLEVLSQFRPEQDVIHTEKIENETSRSQWSPTDNTDSLQDEDEENVYPVLQERGFSIGGIDIGSITNGGTIFSGMGGISSWTGERISIANVNGLTIRTNNMKNHQGITITNNQVFIGDKLVCDDISKVASEATYQKSADGTHWYTNLKVGKPMTKSEIDKFETEWAQYEKEQEEKARQREAEWKRRDEERERRLRQREEERDKLLKEREEKRESRLKQQEEERKMREKEREKRLKENQERLETRLRQQELERNQRQRELEKSLREREAKRKIPQKGKKDGNALKKMKGKLNEEEVEEKLESKQTDGEDFMEQGAKPIETTFPDGHSDDHDDDEDDLTHFTVGSNSYMLNGKNLQIKNYKGVRLQVTSPDKNQSIVIKGRTAAVNGKVVCRDIGKLDENQTYQKTDDGAEWYTNLQVGEPMTENEIQHFQVEEERQEELEKQRKQTKQTKRRQRKERKKRARKERKAEIAEKQVRIETVEDRPPTDVEGSTRGRRRQVNMSDPFRSDFMEGFMDDFMEGF